MGAACAARHPESVSTLGVSLGALRPTLSSRYEKVASGEAGVTAYVSVPGAIYVLARHAGDPEEGSCAP